MKLCVVRVHFDARKEARRVRYSIVLNGGLREAPSAGQPLLVLARHEPGVPPLPHLSISIPTSQSVRVGQIHDLVTKSLRRRLHLLLSSASPAQRHTACS